MAIPAIAILGQFSDSILLYEAAFSLGWPQDTKSSIWHTRAKKDNFFIRIQRLHKIKATSDWNKSFYDSKNNNNIYGSSLECSSFMSLKVKGLSKILDRPFTYSIINSQEPKAHWN